MTVYVLPCGVSILDGLARGRAGTADATAVVADVVALAGRVHHRTLTATEVAPHWRAELATALDDADLADWRPEVSAETSTLARRGTIDLARLLSAGHRVAVLASDTSRGLAAALLVASRLAGGDLSRLRYAATDEALPAFPPCTVTVVRVAGLAPDTRDGLIQGAAGLGAALRAAGTAATGEELEVHLTGGFKASLLHLLSMTELLHSAGGTTVTAWYLHDDTDNPDQARTVQIGLRRFSARYLQRLGEELSNVAAGREPPSWDDFTLREAAWTHVAGRPTLNGFGAGYLAVLGTTTPDRSDEGG
ncbi:hypothetical protein AB0K00_21775 [Dactylosporangium sp. NPDC049525]|uniref:hypothetical protein n=1 Tax=Dactylosporangium sp. NPDC049525 TaxID=3154730 RepID=UPI0034200375